LTIDPAFTAALQQASLELPPTQVERLQAYAQSLWDWNERLNLTRHTSWELFVHRDLRDVLQLAPLLKAGEEVLDLGSGGGVPGIPLAIVRPDLQISLCESVAKRAAVLNTMVETLALPIPVYASRGEDLLDDFRFDTITVRAVGSLRKLCGWMEPHWSSIGRVLAIKGPKWVEERGEARHHGAFSGLQLRRVATYPLGDGENEGVILQICRQNDPRYV